MCHTWRSFFLLLDDLAQGGGPSPSQVADVQGALPIGVPVELRLAALVNPWSQHGMECLTHVRLVLHVLVVPSGAYCAVRSCVHKIRTTTCAIAWYHCTLMYV